MMKTSVLKFAIVICASLALLTSCEYDIVVPVKHSTPPADDTISFAQDVVPVFSARCIGCHATGATPPDLSVANAFTDLTTNGYVVAKEPESSSLYTACAPGGSMESHCSAVQLDLIYRWIYAGAKNN
jgi:hypothetical protein